MRLYNEKGKDYKFDSIEGITAKESIWESEEIYIDDEPYSLYSYKNPRSKSNCNKYKYLFIKDTWYRIKNNQSIIFMENKLYTKKYYNDKIKKESINV